MVLRVFRRLGKRNAQSNITNTILFGGCSVMVWGKMSLTALTDLVILNNGNLNVERYIQNIFEEHVVPFAHYVGHNFLH